MEATTRLCLTCGKPLKGRLDKKFCDDACRNTFNNQQNSDQNNFVRNINNILRKNRRLLEEQIPEGEEMKKIQREKLASAGFNFKYHTHQYQNQKGQIYFFSYEYGYLPLESGDWLLIVKRKAEI
jgi:predicted nucleic acid-binding Zn ribbon protein